jgi:hypothetical protein
MAVCLAEFDEEKERARLRGMSDEELIREGKAARYMCAPATNFDKPPRESISSLCASRKRSGAGVIRNDKSWIIRNYVLPVTLQTAFQIAGETKKS